MADEQKYAVGPDGRIVNYDPHNQTLKEGWREATDEDLAACAARYAPPKPTTKQAPVAKPVESKTSE